LPRRRITWRLLMFHLSSDFINTLLQRGDTRH